MSSFRLSVVKVQAEKKKPRENGHELLSLEHPPGRGRGDADLPQETWERSQSTGRGGSVLLFISCSAGRKWLQQHTGHAGATAIRSGNGLEVRRLSPAPLANLPVTFSMPPCVKSGGWVNWPLSPWRKTDVGWCPQEEGLPRSLF